MNTCVGIPLKNHVVEFVYASTFETMIHTSILDK